MEYVEVNRNRWEHMRQFFKQRRVYSFMRIILVALFFFTAAITEGMNGMRMAYAGDRAEYAKSNIVVVLCNAVDFIAHGPGKVVAMLILISLAIALFLGKVTWGLAIAVGVGIGLMMGASNIMQILSGDKEDICAGTQKEKEK
ncbi:membrane hypothetical protein [Alphaproteobacteria bacterium]